MPPRAAVTFSQVITPPAGLKDATPKPPEAVVAGAHADGAKTCGSDSPVDESYIILAGTRVKNRGSAHPNYGSIGFVNWVERRTPVSGCLVSPGCIGGWRGCSSSNS